MRTLSRVPLPIALLALACSADGGGGGGDAGLDGGGGDADAPPVWDAEPSEAGLRRADAGFRPDAGTTTCLSEGAPPDVVLETEPIPGARGVQADVDLDGDGAAEVLVHTDDGAAAKLWVVDEDDGSPRELVSAAAGATLTVMPGLWPDTDLRTPVDGALVVLVATADAAFLETHGVNGDGRLGRVDLGGPVAREMGPDAVRLVRIDDGWRAMVNQADGGCSVFDLESGRLDGWDRCRLGPGWDGNGDGRLDGLRVGARGAHLIDLAMGVEYGGLMAPPATLGFAPVDGVPAIEAPGAVEVRRNGPEVVAARVAENVMSVTFHSLPDFSLTAEAPPVAGDFVRLEFHHSRQGMQLFAEEARRGLAWLVIFDLPSMNRLGEFGPYRHLTWGRERPGGIAHPIDHDGDGYPEIPLISGADPDGIGSDYELRDARDGEERFSVEADRSAALIPIVPRKDGAGRLVDLDGCDGEELALLRSGAAGEDGRRPTRLLYAKSDGRLVHRGEPRNGAVHALAVGPVADGEYGVVELFDPTEDGSASVVRILR
jgi:hypothetical protein